MTAGQQVTFPKCNLSSTCRVCTKGIFEIRISESASLLSFGVHTQCRWGWRGGEIPEAAVCKGIEWWSITTRKYPLSHTKGPCYTHRASACPLTCINSTQGRLVWDEACLCEHSFSAYFSLNITNCAKPKAHLKQPLGRQMAVWFLSEKAYFLSHWD